MKAIILAAGRGSRMKNLTNDRPKCLVEVRGKALIDWQLDALRNAGISQIAVVTGYKREKLIDRGLVEFHNPRWNDTNMVSSLECAHTWLREHPCIVSYSDIYYESVAVRLLVTSTANLAITYDPNWLDLWKRRFLDPLQDAETFRLAADGTLLEIGKKPGSAGEVEGQYMGLLKFTPTGWAEVQRLRAKLSAEKRDQMHMTETLQMIIESGQIPVAAIRYEGEWGEIDSQDDLRAMA